MRSLNIDNVAVSQISSLMLRCLIFQIKITFDFKCGRKRDVGVGHQEIFHIQAIHLYTDGSKSGGKV